MTADTQEAPNRERYCGGCGEGDPSKRCLGCLADFGPTAQPAPRADLVERIAEILAGRGVAHIEYCRDLAREIAAFSEAPAKPLPPTRTALIAALRQHYQHARDTHHFKAAYTIEDVIGALSEAPREAEGWPKAPKFKFGERVTKTKGSSWTGLVCGFYSTALTLNGYCVESENEPGSVQLYPVAALSATPKREG